MYYVCNIFAELGLPLHIHFILKKKEHLHNIHKKVTFILKKVILMFHLLYIHICIQVGHN